MIITKDVLNSFKPLDKHLRQLPDNKKKFRDIALVLTGFFGAFRRSELVSIQIEDLIDYFTAEFYEKQVDELVIRQKRNFLLVLRHVPS